MTRLEFEIPPDRGSDGSKIMAIDNNHYVQDIAAWMFEILARCFPVCSASDEFHYFPQAQAQKEDWSRWDDFSPEAVEELAGKLLAWGGGSGATGKKHVRSGHAH